MARLAPAEPTRPDSVAPAPTPQMDAAAARLADVATAAIARGVWTDDDLAAFRRELPFLDPPHIQEAMGRIAVAIDEGRLRPTTTGSILF